MPKAGSKRKKGTVDIDHKETKRSKNNNVEETNMALQVPIFVRHRRHPDARYFDASDVHDAQARVAKEFFTRMVNLMPTQNTRLHQDDALERLSIDSIDHIVNDGLSAKFQSFKNKLINEGVDAKELLLFHGTKINNIDSILERNFDFSRIARTAFGRGMYFSEFPSVSIGYGDSLLLCRVLLGRCQPKHEDKGFRPDKGYDSFTHQELDEVTRKRLASLGGDMEHCSEIHVIGNPDQILPTWVINLKGSRPSSKNLASTGGGPIASQSQCAMSEASTSSSIHSTTSILSSYLPTSQPSVSSTPATSNSVVTCSVCYAHHSTINTELGAAACSDCRTFFSNMIEDHEFSSFVECIQVLEGQSMCLSHILSRAQSNEFMRCNYCRFAGCMIAGLNWTKMQRQLGFDKQRMECGRDLLSVFVMELNEKVPVPKTVFDHL